MKKSLFFVFAFIFCMSTLVVRAENLTEGLGLQVGYKMVNLDSSFSHTTHSDDASFMSGDPGSTELNTVHFLAIGGRYQQHIAKDFWVNIDLGGLIGSSRDEHQNDNDTRQSSSGSYVYSESSWGVYGCVGVNYACGEDWYIGADTQLAGVSVEHGWDRWNKDQSENDEFVWVPTIGPKIGYVFDNYSLEATVQVGSGVGAGIMFSCLF